MSGSEQAGAARAGVVALACEVALAGGTAAVAERHQAAAADNRPARRLRAPAHRELDMTELCIPLRQ